MKTVKIEVLDAVIDGKRKGEQLDVQEKAAETLVKMGYAKLVEQPKEDPKPEAPKKKPASRSKKSN